MLAPTASGATSPAPTPSMRRDVVVHVADGDTLDVRDQLGITRRVRVLYVDTPEIGGCLAAEATAFTKQWAARPVRLSFDVDRTDPYGRTLAEVHDPTGRSLAPELAARGLGVPMRVEPNHRGFWRVEAASLAAQTGRLGLFDPRLRCTPAGRIRAAQRRLTNAGRVLVTTGDRAQAGRLLQRAERILARLTPASAGFGEPSLEAWLASAKAPVLAQAAVLRAALRSGDRA